jgi:hypothetical protein
MSNGTASDLELALDVEAYHVLQTRGRLGKPNVPQSENQRISFWKLPGHGLCCLAQLSSMFALRRAGKPVD